MRDEILKKLEKLADTPLGKIYFGVPGCPPPPGASFQPLVRFNFILSGEKIVKLPLKNGPQDVCLKTGNAHYSLTNSWELQSWNSRHEMLCIVPRINYLRISFYQMEDGENGMPQPSYYHTDRPYSDVLRYSIEAMNSCANQENSLTTPHLARTIIMAALEECRKHGPLGEGKAMHTFEKIRRWLENSMQQEINREDAARHFEVSASYISQLFKKMCGMNFHEYLTNCRFNFAKQLLCNTNLTVYQIADQCGFKSHVHFVRRFREINGMPPGQYRDTILAGMHDAADRKNYR